MLTQPSKPELKVITRGKVPRGERITPAAMMPKILCCISEGKASVYKGHECVRRFQHFQNGIKKRDKLFIAEALKASKMLKKLGDTFIRRK